MKTGIGVFKGTQMVQKRAAFEGTCRRGTILPLYDPEQTTPPEPRFPHSKGERPHPFFSFIAVRRVK